MDCDRLHKMAQILIDDFRHLGAPLQSIPLPPIQTLSDTNPWSDDPPCFWQTQPTGPLLVWHRHGEIKDRPANRTSEDSNLAKRRLPKIRVLLMIHYDTVYPPGASPQTTKLDSDDRLIGPGVADAKGGIAVIALAIEAILKFNLFPNLDLSIVFNPDEEIGSPASSSWLRSACDQYEMAWLFEPSLPSGHYVSGRKGSGNFAVHVKGQSAHAGRHIEQGRNAIVHLAQIVLEIMTMHKPSNGITVNVGKTMGGGPLNRVPDHATLQLNARVVHPNQCEEVKHQLDTIASDYTRDGYVVQTCGDFHCPPKTVSDSQRELQKLIEASGQMNGQRIKWQDTGGACDGSKLAAWGLPNIDTLGVIGGDLHSPSEWMRPSSLLQSAKLLVFALSRTALTGVEWQTSERRK